MELVSIHFWLGRQAAGPAQGTEGFDDHIVHGRDVQVGFRSVKITRAQLTFNSTLVLVTDTWLHFSTKTIIFTQVGANLNPSGLGFGLHHNCSEQTPEIMTCTLVMLGNGYVREDNEALKIFANVSDTMSIPTHTDFQD